MEETIQHQIAQWLEPKLETLGLYLVDTEFKPSGELNVYIDGVRNVSISQCAEVSRYLEAFLDESEQIKPNYNLQVSSPGMMNPLKVPQQFQKRIGQRLEVKTTDQQLLDGWLINADGEQISIYPQKGGNSGSTKNKALKKVAPDLNKIDQNELITISYSSIDKAMLKFEF